MTSEEQIQKMAELTFDYVDSKNRSKLYLMGSNADEEMKPLLHNYGLAEFLYNAGYRKSDEYEADIEYLNRRIAELEQDLVHADENVFFREQNVVLYEEKIKSEARKETAKEILDEVFKEVERVRLETEFKDETGKWLIDEHEFFTEFTIGALYELYKKYGVEVEE